jgi:hypothetical protein
MFHDLYFALFLAGAICFFLALLKEPPLPWLRPKLIPLGLLLWILVYLIQSAKVL